MNPSMANWETVMKLFPAAEADHSQKVYEVQQMVSLLFDLNNYLVQAFLRCKETRPATLLFLGKVLRLNEGYFKTMHQNEVLCSRFLMTQLCAILIESALPIFAKGEFDYTKLPSYYVLHGADNPTVITFGGADTERIVHYDEARPCPTYPADAPPYKPFVHLFFLAARAMMYIAAFIDMHDRDARQATHPQSGQREREALTSEKCLYEALLQPQKLALSRLQLLNYMAKWLLHLMDVRPDGTLPSEVPEQWNYLPQQLVDTVVRATQMAPKDGLFIDGMISLMLVLMGNTNYFPKPHTHTLFPSYLMSILNDYSLRKVLEAHPWFKDHIVRSCIRCYIAVEKANYERLEVRYELAHCLKRFLEVDSLCAPVREEFGRQGTVLERFSHMAVAEVNAAVDQLIQTLTEMNEAMKNGADLSETAVAAPAAAADGTAENADANRGARNGGRRSQGRGASATNNEEDADDEEAEEQADGTRTYHQMGLSLRSHIMLFNASIDMFNQIAAQFEKGVSQNMVAQQISQMLSRSLVCFAGPKSKSLKIEFAERYEYRPREILSRLVDCITRFRRSRSFLQCMCKCGIPLPDIHAAMKMVVERQLVTEDLIWRLSEMNGALQKVSEKVGEEDALWDDAPDYALDALLSTPLTHPVALPSDVKNLADLIFVNSDTIHHHLLSESKNPFTNEHLDEAILKEFNERPEIKEACEALKKRIAEWVQEAKEKLNNNL
ncbi:ubiquitin conjugation factor E4 B [Strigomonas culicis]|nr:ubiquitin conjugation factor E4 B [Strigomonas culicis]|eukprot:EPY26623.1 ubiquitin conjugation factor E4 B [Strigomonas culicis]